MALVNARKEFVMVDVGTNGRVSDGGVLFYTKFWELYQQGALNLPQPSTMPKSTDKFPYVFVADDAFALGPNLMKPYPRTTATKEETTYNYRLSKARSVVECAFGMLSSKFGVFQTAINLKPEKATKITSACCYLHNYLLKEIPHVYQQSNSAGDVDNLVQIQPTKSKNTSKNAKLIRDKFCKYFCTDDKL